MNQSHISQRDDYEATCIELDTPVDSAWRWDAIGSRMLGAGFRGCIVNLVYDNMIEELIEEIGKEYEEKIGYKADFYVGTIVNGAVQI